MEKMFKEFNLEHFDDCIIQDTPQIRTSYIVTSAIILGKISFSNKVIPLSGKIFQSYCRY